MATLEPVQDLYGYGPPDGARIGYFDDPSLIQTAGTIALDLFLIFAVAFTLFTAAKRLMALGQKVRRRGRPTEELSP